MTLFLTLNLSFKELNFIIVSLFLKSKVNLDLRFGFSVPKSSRETNFQPDWTELRTILKRVSFNKQVIVVLFKGTLINSSWESY